MVGLLLLVVVFVGGVLGSGEGLGAFWHLTDPHFDPEYKVRWCLDVAVPRNC